MMDELGFTVSKQILIHLKRHGHLPPEASCEGFALHKAGQGFENVFAAVALYVLLSRRNFVLEARECLVFPLVKLFKIVTSRYFTADADEIYCLLPQMVKDLVGETPKGGHSHLRRLEVKTRSPKASNAQDWVWLQWIPMQAICKVFEGYEKKLNQKKSIQVTHNMYFVVVMLQHAPERLACLTLLLSGESLSAHDKGCGEHSRQIGVNPMVGENGGKTNS